MFLIFALRQKSFGLKTIHRIVFFTPSTQVCRFAVRPTGLKPRALPTALHPDTEVKSGRMPQILYPNLPNGKDKTF